MAIHLHIACDVCGKEKCFNISEDSTSMEAIAIISNRTVKRYEDNAEIKDACPECYKTNEKEDETEKDSLAHPDN